MAVNRIYKFSDINLVEYFLKGAALGAEMPKQSGETPGWIGLVGLTLKIGATTVTFIAGSGPEPQKLQFSDVKAQVEGAVATVLVTTVGGRLCIVEKTPTSGITIDKTGSANAMLGFDSNANTVTKVYAPPGTSPPVAPCWTWAYSVNENAHVVYTWE